jgi:hypothetical protein
MTTPTPHTPGPWTARVLAETGRTYATILAARGDIATIGSSKGQLAEEIDANARLIAAAPAYALVWSLVPDEIRQRIFDALHKPDTSWVERAIDAAEGR